MRSNPRAALLVALLAGPVAGCDFDSLGPGEPDVAVVRVQVTGGLAATDYTYEVSSQGSVTGVECASRCSFAPGDTLLLLTPAQSEAFLDAVNRSGLPTSGRPADFGTGCCDRHTYRVVYTAGREVRSFSGGMENLPALLQELVSTLQRFYGGVPPLVLRQSEGLRGFGTDAVDLLDPRVEDGTLLLEVVYGGGCVEHHLDAVAWTGWMESNPVQVGVALTHDDRNDMCDALVRRTLAFDLAPLRRAYQEAYGPGAATLVLRVQVAGAGPATPVAFSF